MFAYDRTALEYGEEIRRSQEIETANSLGETSRSVPLSDLARELAQVTLPTTARWRREPGRYSPPPRPSHPFAPADPYFSAPSNPAAAPTSGVPQPVTLSQPCVTVSELSVPNVRLTDTGSSGTHSVLTYSVVV
jgi:hypothetical protein